MARYDTYREELAKSYPIFGVPLWNPEPAEFPAVEVGDVGFIRQGRFHRLFNALLPANHPSHVRFGVPADHEPLQPSLVDHIDGGITNPSIFSSYGVTVASSGLESLAAGGGSAEAMFSCTKKQGAALWLPVTARREDTLARGYFRKWITANIDSWFTFTRDLGLEVEMVEDIILVTGCHRARSWFNIVFSEVQADAKLSLGVKVAGALSTNVDWQDPKDTIQGARFSHRPNSNGKTLPENQCIFIRGFRVKRLLFGFPRIKAAAEVKEDTRGNDCDPERQVTTMPSATEYRDPLHLLLEYITTRAPDCDMAVVHDDDLEQILRVGDRTSLEDLQPEALIDYLQRSQHEIEVTSDSFPACDQTTTQNMTVAQLKSLDPPVAVPSPSHFPSSTTGREELAHSLLEARESVTQSFTEKYYGICVATTC